MAISVAVPKNLSGIKTKVAMNLTKRQLVCFGSAAAVGIPFYLVTKGVLGTQASALIMVALMLPFFFLAMYEKDGFPAEKILYFMVRQKILTPGIRPYKSENLYKQLEEREKMKKEVRYLEEKAAGKRKQAGLIDVDGHNFPNLCLMKLSACHKARGDMVEWYDKNKWYDLVYMSRVFTDTYSKDYEGNVKAYHVIKGGTGYGLDNKLPDIVEHTHPDYGLYPQFAGTAYGFLSRGCPRGCGFCIVGEKEGRKTEAVADLSEFWGGEKEIKLLDANILACPDWERLLGQLADSGATVDFTQGLDVRLITPEKVAALNRIKTKMLHFAWDNPEDDLIPFFQRFLEHTAVKDKRKRRVYVLTNYGSTHEQDLYRIYALRDMGYDPYVMIYEKPTAPEETRKMQRWVNNKWLFHSVKDFKDYVPSGYRKKGQ